MAVFTGDLLLVPGDRLYTPVWQLVQLSASVIAAGLSVARGGAYPREGWDSIHESHQFGTHVWLPITGVMERSINNEQPESLMIRAGPFENAPVIDPSGGKSQWSALLELIASVIFVNVYEAHKPWMDDTYRNDLSKWPPVLNFARVVRNAIAHSGHLYFKDPQTSPGGEWHHIRYEAARHGEKIIGTELFFPDLVLLTIEMAQTLDSEGAPILT